MLSGCASVKPWERDQLAHPVMQLDSEPVVTTCDVGVRSHTVDFGYRWQYHERRYFEPHVRYYHQLKSDFYHVGVRNDRPLPTFASADYRLADIAGVTIGARMGWTLKDESRLVLRAEYYTPTGEGRPNEAVGAQRAYDLFPTLNASIIQIDYAIKVNGVTLSHILNPKTGWPVAEAPESVTVAAKTCTEAGFWSSLAVLQGADAESFLKANQLEAWCYRTRQAIPSPVQPSA